jgi:AcrR family transcriptional regulator
MDQEKQETQIKAETQDEILLAALQLFAEKGYFNTSLIDIKDHAGVKNTSGIYHYFKNKNAIAGALYANIFDSLNVSVDEIRRRNNKSSEQLRGVVDLLFKLTQDAPDVMRFLLLVKYDEFLADEKPIMETSATIKIVKIIQSGMNTGEIRSIDPYLAYGYFFGVVNNTLRLILSGTLDKSPDFYLSQTWLAAWNAIAKKANV